MIERFYKPAGKEQQCTKTTFVRGRQIQARAEAIVLSVSPLLSRLGERGAQDMLIRAAACAAACKLAVNDNSRDTADAVLFRLGGRLGLMHVMDHNLVRRTGYSFDEFDGFLACGTARAEDFDFLSCGHGVLLKNSWISSVRQSGHVVRSLALSRRGRVFQSEAITNSPIAPYTASRESQTNVPSRTPLAANIARAKGPYPRRFFALKSIAAQGKDEKRRGQREQVLN